MINDLTIVKAHLKVDTDAEDALITLYMDAAEDYIRKFLDLDELKLPGETDDPVVIPANIKQAHLLLVGSAHSNREALSEKAMHNNPAVIALLNQEREKLGV